MYDVIIVGGGPAGAAAGVYAARKHLKTLLITSEWGGQSTVSEDVQNWIGTPHISGADLAKALKTHVESYAGEFLTILSPKTATALATTDASVSVTLHDGSVHEGKTLLIATGAVRRKLEVPGATEFDMKGLTYCASCDGPLYAGMDVAVIGGGNAAFETAAQLLAYCKSVTLLNRSEHFRADPITVEKVVAHPNMKIITNAIPTAVIGDTFATGLTYKDTQTNEEHTLETPGIFVEIGLIPNTAWVSGCAECIEDGRIKVDPRTQQTSHPLVWAAGDCTDARYHQNNIAAGDAITALEDIYIALRAR